MKTERLEQQIREHAGSIFGKELPSGHRDRFEARLDTGARTFPLRKTALYLTAIAAAVAGIVFMAGYHTTAAEEPDTRIADVRNYYDVQLEEQTDATIELLQDLNQADNHFLLANIEQLRNQPLPDVQLTDDDYIILIAQVYTRRLESLQQIQDAIKSTIDNGEF